MKGDFSQWGFEPGDNWNGVLHQQGRVLLDQDWNAAARAAGADGFKLVQAASDGTEVTITLQPGELWADGLHLLAPGNAALVRKAPYLGAPIQSPQASAATIGASVRDAVILEAREE